MQSYSTDHIRNVVLLSHCGAGKSSLSEAMLFTSGAIPRLGRVDDGSSTSDFDPDEVKRKISINLSVLPCEWSGNKVNVLDAPGYADFVAGAVAGVAVADAAIIVICAASGIEVGTELMWKMADGTGSASFRLHQQDGQRECRLQQGRGAGAEEVRATLRASGHTDRGSFGFRGCGGPSVHEGSQEGQEGGSGSRLRSRRRPSRCGRSWWRRWRNWMMN